MENEKFKEKFLRKSGIKSFFITEDDKIKLNQLSNSEMKKEFNDLLDYVNVVEIDGDLYLKKQDCHLIHYTNSIDSISELISSALLAIDTISMSEINTLLTQSEYLSSVTIERIQDNLGK